MLKHAERPVEAHNRFKTGFTLIEVLISLFVVSTVVIVGFQILSLGNRVSARSRIILSANAIAFAKIQEYENKEFNNITNGVSGNNYEIEDFSTAAVSDSDGNIKAATAKVHSEPISLSLKKLKVKVTYKVFSEFKTIEYATYIQLGGVGR